MRVAVIPARGGSKRIPRKNIKEFCGKPMIAYAIDAALRSKLFDRIIVSTDDIEIAEIAKHCGAQVPFIRPAELSDDYVATVPVVAHAIQSCKKLGWKIDIACCIYPSVPFISIKDLKDSLDLIENSGVDYCYPITEYASPIQRALRFFPDGTARPFYPEFELTRTQDLEVAYHDAGQFYWGRANAWLTNPKIHNSGLGFRIPNWRVVDIDSVDDWIRAEILANVLLGDMEN